MRGTIVSHSISSSKETGGMVGDWPQHTKKTFPKQGELDGQKTSQSGGLPQREIAKN